MPRSATSVDATLVDLESLIQSTPRERPRGLDAMLQRAEAAQRLGDPRARLLRAMRLVGAHHGERGGERVGDVVIAEQREVAARDERRAEHDELSDAAIVVAVGRAGLRS